ncbi:hypothetical protein M408DRAFT_331409 [Serendipita vermifera MAFF 305830]|uniref:Uncharacterized protein n=1 Tax=Serendipita vermifera MAFF 305830 TaxID=933852 RepID=A0A0C3AKP5_SERVB|nr:hypothetical protein M408DRAFT_331409 [Serendipita vermifera MAFF 305830]
MSLPNQEPDVPRSTSTGERGDPATTAAQGHQKCDLEVPRDNKMCRCKHPNSAHNSTCSICLLEDGGLQHGPDRVSTLSTDIPCNAPFGGNISRLMAMSPNLNFIDPEWNWNSTEKKFGSGPRESCCGSCDSFACQAGDGCGCRCDFGCGCGCKAAINPLFGSLAPS